ncbi:MAG: tRNA pseudouridine(38-40) synthase TruA [Bacteroidales bacterium]|nr:tRNA pseudouridine(38-40) synthase TruA [Bacteroidales bacterium]MBR2298919.1 tRNA pseudouridine(38-40) synthase TruA [Bacteroidales bacterium]
MRYFLCISYRGSGFSGWQIQENAPTIEAEVEKVLSTLLGEPIDVVGAGRTDTGVNAKNFYAHFDTSRDKLLADSGKMVYKMNAILPYGISVNSIFPVHDDAHARFDATHRTYKYYIHCTKDPFCESYSYFCKFDLDTEAMNRGARYLLGKKDFSSFEKLHGGNATSICEVTEAKWEEYIPVVGGSDSAKYLVFTITANRFLRNMVRAIVGSLVEIGRGRKDPEWIEELLSEKNRCAAGQSVPGHALFLTEVRYPYIENNKINK